MTNCSCSDSPSPPSPAVARRAREIEALPSLGLLTLAGMSPPHIGAEYLEVRDFDEIPDRFDVIALSTLSATAKETYAMAARFREKGIPVILGAKPSRTYDESRWLSRFEDFLSP